MDLGLLGLLGVVLQLLRGEVEVIREGTGVLGAFTNSKVTGVLGVISVGTEILVVIREEVLRVTTRAKRCKSIVQWGGLFTFLGCYNW